MTYEWAGGRGHVTEAQFLNAVVDAAHLYGWRVAHFRPARTMRGWRTPMVGDPGFPDLVLARNGTVLLVELKSATGKLTTEQRAWAAAIGASWEVWRPADMDLLLGVLR